MDAYRQFFKSLSVNKIWTSSADENSVKQRYKSLGIQTTLESLALCIYPSTITKNYSREPGLYPEQRIQLYYFQS